MNTHGDPAEWANKEWMKWHLYELEKRKLQTRDLTAIQYEREIQKIIEGLKL